MKTYYLRMTSAIVLTLLTLEFSPTILSQTHKVYFSTGYDIPTTTKVIGYFRSSTSYSQNISTFSKGIFYQIGYQYNVTNNFILDLNVNYLPGVKDKEYLHSSSVNSDDYAYYSTSNISISPDIQIKFDAGIFSPYAKFGCSINFIQLDLKEVDARVIDIPYKRALSYKSSFSLGLIGGFGVDVKLNKIIVGYLEAQLNSHTYYPDKVTITDVDLSSGHRFTATYNIKESFHYTDTDRGVLKQDFPYSSLGIILGLRVVI